MKNGEDPQQTPTEVSPEEAPESPQELPESQPSSLSPDGEVSESTSVEEVVIPAEGAEVFQHPLLAGKSNEEIEALVSAQAAAGVSQNEELNRYHARVQELEGTQPSAPTPVEEAAPYGDGFMAEGFQVLEERLKKHQAEMIAPLQEEVRAGKTSSARETMRNKLEHFSVLEPHIDTILREKNIDPNTADEVTLETVYFTARGLAAERKINLTETPTEAAPVSIPQHRPSASPLPKEPEKTLRPLTEQERQLAYIQFKGHEDPEGEYRRMQSIEDDEVVEPGFSKEGWR